MKIFLSTTLLVCATGTAMAGPFVTTDRMDGDSHLGAMLSYALTDLDDVTIVRVEAHGEIALPGQPFGVYGSVPLAHAGDDNDSDTALGNVEVGGFYATPATGKTRFIGRAGLTAPTASDELGKFFAVAYATGNSRLTDFYAQAIPEGVILRIAGAAEHREGAIVVRADLGLDAALSNAGDETSDPVLRLNLAGAYDLGSAALLGEFNLLEPLEDGEDSATALTLGVRGETGQVSPYGAITIPLGDAFDEIDATLSVGAAFRM